MSAAFLSFVAAKDVMVKAKPARIPEGSTTVLGIVVRRIVKAQKADAPKAGKEPPVKYAIRLVEDVTLTLKKSAKEEDGGMDASEGAVETRGFPALYVQYISIFKGPLDLRPGHVYEFGGAQYQSWVSPTAEGPIEPLISLCCTVIKPAKFDVAAFLLNLSFKVGSLKWEQRPPSFFAMPLEQDTERLKALTLVRGWPNAVARLQLPDTLSTNNLIKEYGEAGKSDHKREIGLSAGKINNGYADAVAMVFQCEDMDGLQHSQVPVQFNGDKSTFDDFMLEPDEWEELAPALLPVATGVFFGEIDHERTEALPPMVEFERVIVSKYGMVRLDAAEMIKRAGVPIDWAGLTQLLSPVTALTSSYWKTSFVRTDPNASVVNLSNVEGDISGLQAMVEASVVQLFVVGNWKISDKDFKALCALDMVARVNTIIGADDRLNLGYGKTAPVQAVYALGLGVVKAIQPVQVKKKGRAE